jgi:hypothetical protein
MKVYLSTTLDREGTEKIESMVNFPCTTLIDESHECNFNLFIVTEAICDVYDDSIPNLVDEIAMISHCAYTMPKSTFIILLEDYATAELSRGFWEEAGANIFTDLDEGINKLNDYCKVVDTFIKGK